jgi:acyl-coenzyme A synthetase/AMP-(fatty) acid ligase
MQAFLHMMNSSTRGGGWLKIRVIVNNYCSATKAKHWNMQRKKKLALCLRAEEARKNAMTFYESNHRAVNMAQFLVGYANRDSFFVSM